MSKYRKLIIDDEVSQALSQAGVGKRYHKQRLQDYPEFKEITEWVGTYGPLRRKVINDGEGINLIGNINAVKAIRLTARISVLFGLDTKLVDVTKLALILTESKDKWEEYIVYFNYQHLLLTNFYTLGAEDNSLEYYHTKAVMNLLQERLDAGKATSIASEIPIMKTISWWGNISVLDDLHNINKTVLV